MMISGAFSLNGKQYSIKNEHYDERILVLSFIESLPESLKQVMAQMLFDQLVNHDVYLSTIEW